MKLTRRSFLKVTGISLGIAGCFPKEPPYPIAGIEMVPLGKLKIRRSLSRSILIEDLDRMIESVGKIGLQNPIVVRRLPDGNFEVLDGICRLIGARANEIEMIPCRCLDLSEDECSTYTRLKSVTRSST